MIRAFRRWPLGLKRDETERRHVLSNLGPPALHRHELVSVGVDAEKERLQGLGAYGWGSGRIAKDADNGTPGQAVEFGLNLPEVRLRNLAIRQTQPHPGKGS